MPDDSATASAEMSENEGRTLSSDSISKLASSATLVAFGAFLYSMSNLIERVIIARFLSVEAYGQVAIGISVMTLGVTVALLGFGQGIPRYVSRFDNTADVRGAWLTGLIIAGSASIAVAGLMLLGAEQLSGLLFGESPNTALLQLFILAIPFSVGLRIAIGGIRGMENTRYRTYAQDLLFPGARLGLVVLLLVAGVGVYAAGLAYIVAAAVSGVAAHLLLNRLFPLIGTIRSHPVEMLTFSLPLVGAGIVRTLLTRVDTLMIGAIRTSTEVGLYSAAFPLATGLQLFLGSFGFMYLPMASRMDASGDFDELNRMYRLTTKWVFVLTFPVFVLLAVFPDDVLNGIFGPEYAAAAPVLTILAIGFIIEAAAGRNGETLLALGLSRFTLAVNLVAFTGNIIINVLLIPRYGILGAAVASAAAFTIRNTLVYVVLRREFGITPFSTYSTRTFVVLPIAIIPLSAVISHFTSLSLPGVLAVGVALAATTVVVVAITGCLQAEDRILVDLIEGKLGRELPFIRRYLPEE